MRDIGHAVLHVQTAQPRPQIRQATQTTSCPSSHWSSRRRGSRYQRWRRAGGAWPIYIELEIQPTGAQIGDVRREAIAGRDVYEPGWRVGGLRAREARASDAPEERDAERDRGRACHRSPPLYDYVGFVSFDFTACWPPQTGRNGIGQNLQRDLAIQVHVARDRPHPSGRPQGPPGPRTGRLVYRQPAAAGAINSAC